ncbi:hypothetical protein F5Y16DRAFT_422826 [Xylariaceae sp. FL0255]|nr:hypothetical protein F5Y16DRAFT_422826 [Xylariaceae sp. FL0255]
MNLSVFLSAYNENLAETPASSARIYTSTYMRHWNVWKTPQLNALFGGVLKKKGNSYKLQGELTNYVTGICNVTCAESPYNQSDQSDYDISSDGSALVFLRKTRACRWRTTPLTSSTTCRSAALVSTKDAILINGRGTTRYPETQGAAVYPRFSPDGSKISYLQMNGIAYESDRSILYVANAKPAGEGSNVTRLAGNGDRSLDSSAWSTDSKTVYVSAPDLGRDRIFPIPLTARDDYVPKDITNEGVSAGLYVLPSGDLLVSDSKIWSSRNIFSVSPTGNDVRT